MRRIWIELGDWRLVDAFSPPEGISESAPKKLKSLVLEASCSISTLFAESCCSSPLVSSEPCTAVKTKELFLSYQLIVDCRIHKDMLKHIWRKAEYLVSDHTLVTPVPGSSTTCWHRMVASSSVVGGPHILTTPAKFSGQFKCDSKCPMYFTYKICSHTTASAEVNGKLSEFLNWFLKQKSVSNLSNLAMVGLPKELAKRVANQSTHVNVSRLSVPTQKKSVVDRLGSSSEEKCS